LKQVAKPKKNDTFQKRSVKPSSAMPAGKASAGKLAEFFGAESELEVNLLLSQIKGLEEGEREQKSPAEEKPDSPSPSVSPSPSYQHFPRRRGQSNPDFDDVDSEEEAAAQPKRAAKLAHFFGVSKNEENIKKIRSEMEDSSQRSSGSKGCLGESMIRVSLAGTKFKTTYSLMVKVDTTASECIRMILAKMGIESDPSNYELLESTKDMSNQKPLQPDMCPLTVLFLPHHFFPALLHNQFNHVLNQR